MLSALAVLLTLLLSLQGTGFSHAPLDNTGAPVDTGALVFTVESAEAIGEYAGITPGTGNRLVRVAIITANPTAEVLPLYDWHYSIRWGTTFLDWDYCFVALDSTMAPLEYSLSPGETVTWQYIYEIPAHITNPCIVYIEYGEDEATGGQTETARYAAFIPVA